MWEIKKFNELTTEELFAILYLRTEIFVVQQKRIYQEVDQNDLNAIHIFNTVDGKIAAYARIFSQNDNVTFGRVVTAPDFRGQGLGNELMQQIFEAIEQYFPKKQIEIEAQTHVENFYKKFDFTSYGEPFLFQHTPHIKMFHQPLSN